MAKKKRTRRQKELADIRRHELASALGVRRHTSQSTAPSFSLEPSIQIQNEAPTAQPAPIINKPASAIATHDYRYLSSDLLKTMILTCSIIIAEIVLRFLAK